MGAPKIIVIRGNSGSGKSTVAKKIRERSKKKIAIIGQDYLRLTVLNEKETPSGDNIDLIFNTAVFALERGYHVILEGILRIDRYGVMLKKLYKQYESHFYYLDASLEETLKRHITKPNSHEFGEKELRKWYKEHDPLNFSHEKIIPETSSVEETITLIKKETGL